MSQGLVQTRFQIQLLNLDSKRSRAKSSFQTASMEQARKSKIENKQEQGLSDNQDLAIEKNLTKTTLMIQGESFLMSDEATPKDARYCKGVIVGNDITLDE